LATTHAYQVGGELITNLTNNLTTVDAPLVAEIFDDLNGRRTHLVNYVVGSSIAILLLLFAVWHSGALLRYGGVLVVIVSWCLLIVFTLGIPRAINDLIAEYHSVPAFRFSQQGIWSRDWSSFGWIEFNDLEAIIVYTRSLRHGPERHELILKFRDHDKYIRRLNWLDLISVMAVGLLNRVAGTDNKTLLLASSDNLGTSWQQLMATLDPLLVAHCVPKQERRASESDATNA
jgi:hypothetical protein